MYIQVKLSQDTKILICWIPINKRVRIDTKLTLKGLDGWWNVDEMYSIIKPKDRIYRDWKVGGLI